MSGILFANSSNLALITTRYVPGMFRHATADYADGLVYMASVDVRISKDHGQSFVPADPLNGREVNTGLH